MAQDEGEVVPAVPFESTESHIVVYAQVCTYIPL